MKIVSALVVLMLAVILPGCIQPMPPVITGASAFYYDEKVVEFHANSDDSFLYVWDTGDGGVAYGKNPTYEYSDYGKYTVVVTATNNTGTSSKFILPVSVEPWSVCFYEDVQPGSPWACTYRDLTKAEGK